MKKLLALVMSAVMILSLAGCAQQAAAPAATQAAAPAATQAAAPAATQAAAPAATEAPKAEAPAEEGPKKVAYLAASTSTPFWTWCQDGIESQAKELGWEPQTFDSNDDPSTQLKNCQNAISSGFDAIIISPTDSASCVAVCEECEAAGVPLVICDVGSEDGKYLTFVATPNYDGAKEVGEYLGKYLNEKGVDGGKVGQITIPLSRLNGQLRTQGFADGLAEYGYEVGTTLETADWTLEEADGQTRNIVQGMGDEIVAIFTNHDLATSGAVEALKDLGVIDKIPCASFDGNPDIVEYLQTGEVLVCGAQQPKKMGKESVNALKDFWDGKEVPEEIGVPTILLTADNVLDNLDAIENDVCGLN